MFPKATIFDVTPSMKGTRHESSPPIATVDFVILHVVQVQGRRRCLRVQAPRMGEARGGTEGASVHAMPQIKAGPPQPRLSRRTDQVGISYLVCIPRRHDNNIFIASVGCLTMFILLRPWVLAVADIADLIEYSTPSPFLIFVPAVRVCRVFRSTLHGAAFVEDEPLSTTTPLCPDQIKKEKLKRWSQR